MTLLEAIKCRHSVRKYLDRPISEEIVSALQTKIEEINKNGNLHAQLIVNEPKAFKGFASYGVFSGVSNYIVMAGKKADDLSLRVGYYGEQLVLYAQTIGLNSCWVGLTYSKIENTYQIDDNERVVCYIAVGYGQTQGVCHKHKTPQEVSNISDLTPQWFNDGVDAALLAPTAVNQQKFYFEYVSENKVLAKTKKSLAGYTQIDLGIAKLHFEIGAGNHSVNWIK